MKKVFIVLLLTLGVVTLSGCGGVSTQQEQEPIVGKYYHLDAEYIGEYIASVDYTPSYKAQDQIYWVLDSGCYFIPQGEGALYLKGKLKYEGEWNFGLPNGKGTLYYENGNKCYEGDWLKGIKEGYGVKYNEAGEIDFEGEWISNWRQE